MRHPKHIFAAVLAAVLAAAVCGPSAADLVVSNHDGPVPAPPSFICTVT